MLDLGNQWIRVDRKYVSPLRDYVEFFGVTYVSIDINGRDGALRYDLRERLPLDELGQFDLVTNFGTTEHIDKQSPTFENIHNLCRVGGIMVHAVPMAAVDHGIWGYSPEWFSDLAVSQGYDPVLVGRFCRDKQLLSTDAECYTNAILGKRNREFAPDKFIDPKDMRK